MSAIIIGYFTDKIAETVARYGGFFELFGAGESFTDGTELVDRRNYTPPKKYSSTWDISCPKTYIKCNFMKWILASHDL